MGARLRAPLAHLPSSVKGRFHFFCQRSSEGHQPNGIGVGAAQFAAQTSWPTAQGAFAPWRCVVGTKPFVVRWSSRTSHGRRRASLYCLAISGSKSWPCFWTWSDVGGEGREKNRPRRS